MSGIRERLCRVALAAAITASAVVASAPEALARKEGAELPALNPNDALTDAKLTPALAKPLADAIADLNARKFADAGNVLRQAKALPALTAYDVFQIDNLTILLAQGTKDSELGARAADEMSRSPALTDRDRHAVYANGVIFAAARKDYWRAIQYGELERRQNILALNDVRLLAGLYALLGSYADAERIAQWGLDTQNPQGKEREKLQKAVDEMQIKEGKIVATPDAGSALLGAVLAGVGQGLAQGLGDPSASQPPPAPAPEDEQASAQADAQTKFQQAEHTAASEVLSADAASERAVYADLADRAARLSAADEKHALSLFKTAYTAWAKENYATASTLFEQGLAIDPANAIANYYYADCLSRGGDPSLAMIDYLARATTFAHPGDPDASQARDVLKHLVGN